MTDVRNWKRNSFTSTAISATHPRQCAGMRLGTGETTLATTADRATADLLASRDLARCSPEIRVRSENHQHSSRDARRDRRSPFRFLSSCGYR